ncbi:MAG: peptide deformylase [Candidatus Bipolaricaulia bacterium]
MELTIRTHPDPVLRRPAEPPARIDGELRELADAMVATLVKRVGYGLAAPQVGVATRLIVVDVEDDFHVLANPEVVATGGEIVTFAEGCLSIPGVEAEVDRPDRAVVEGWTMEGETTRVEAEGLLARVLQHEVDHLNGVLFIDHLSRVKRRQILKEYEKIQNEEGPSPSNRSSTVTA